MFDFGVMWRFIIEYNMYEYNWSIMKCDGKEDDKEVNSPTKAGDSSGRDIQHP